MSTEFNNITSCVLVGGMSIGTPMIVDLGVDTVLAVERNVPHNIPSINVVNVDGSHAPSQPLQQALSF